ncbi:MAG: ABC transporter ATP-binding protein [Flavipsychrobacter sp.]
MSSKRTSAISSVKKLHALFNTKQKRAFNWLILFTFISSISDLVGLGFVIPVVGLVLSETFHTTLVDYLPSLAGLTKNELLVYTVLLFFFLILLKNAFGLYINKLQVNFVRSLYVSSSMNVLEKVYNRSLLDIQKDTSNELVSKLTYYQSALCSNAAISTIILINEMIIFALTAIIVCTYDWRLFLLLIGVLLPVMGGFYAKVKNMIKHAGSEKSQNSIKLYASAQEMIFGYTDIKIAGTEERFKKRFGGFAKNFSVYQARLDFMMFIPTRIIEIVIFMCIIVILLYGVFVLKDAEKIITTITLFSVIAYRSIPSVNRFVMAMNNLNSTDFLFKDPDFTPSDNTEEDTPAIEPLSFERTINFNNVSYQYPGSNTPVLKSCNLEIKKGEKIGIVGKSGSGKSTLVSNLLGFLSPTEGNISIDTTTLEEDNTKNWWKILGYVRQDVFIMNTSFKENIAIGEVGDQIDDARLQRAIKLSSLTDLVNSWENGADTILNERGNNLSGGQKQRIAIARAIYKGAEVLVFDEATSALDSKTEEEITNAIRELGNENLTIIIIAHRYSSLKYCEKIYNIEKGILGSSISYEKLIENQPNHN